ncbi:MAG: universal stress protein [Agarilytica sp.]
MSNYTHILVGLDLSDDCEVILSKAASLAKNNNAEITVAHVFEPLAFAYGGDMPVDLTEAQNIMEKQAKARLRNICKPYEIPESQQLVEIGLTSSEIHDIAEERKADLVVVGSHGRHGLAALFGNTANGVIRGAKCDVLAVRV